MSGVDLAPILESLLAPLAMAAGLAVAVLLYRLVRTKLSADEEAFLRYAAEQAVLYAEELGKAGIKGADKLRLAADAFSRILGRHKVGKRMSELEARTRLLAALEALRGEGLIPGQSRSEELEQLAEDAVDEILQAVGDQPDAAALAAENAVLRRALEAAKRRAEAKPNGGSSDE